MRSWTRPALVALSLALLAACDKTVIPPDPRDTGRADGRRDAPATPLDRAVDRPALDARLDLAADLRRDASPPMDLRPDARPPDTRAPDTRVPDLVPPAKLWATRIGGLGPDLALLMAPDPDGTLVLVGAFSSMLTLGSTTLTAKPGGSMFVARLDPDSGAVLSAAPIDGTGDFTPVFDYAGGLAIDSAKNLYLAGPFVGTATFGGTTLTEKANTDGFVAKLTPSGTWAWAIAIGGALYDQVSDLVLDSAGHLTITGTFGGTAMFGATPRTAVGPSDLYVARLDASGNVLWVATAGGKSSKLSEHGVSLFVDAVGNTFVTGQVRDGAVFGVTKLPAYPSGANGFVAKLDPTGSWVWATPAPAAIFPEGFTANRIALDGGKLYLAGFTWLSTTSDVRVAAAMVDGSGSWVWGTTAPGTAVGWAQNVIVDGGSLLVSGTFGGSTSFGKTTLVAKPSTDNLKGEDAFLARLDPATGKWLSAEAFGGPNHNCAGALATGKAGSLYVAGHVTGATTLGKSTLSSVGERDIYVWKRLTP